MDYHSEEWIGKKYNRLTILGYSKKNFECLCDCGRITFVRPTFLISGRIKTCGLDCEYHGESRKGVSKEKLYSVWKQMLYKCYNPKNPQFPEMQKRQIGVCNEWKNDFWAFRTWAYEHGYEQGKCLTRIRQSIGFQPDNCKWVDKGEQLHKNRKTNYGIKYNILGESLTLQEISQKYNLSPTFLRNRIRKGMTMEEAITAPKYSHTPAYLSKHTTSPDT